MAVDAPPIQPCPAEDPWRETQLCILQAEWLEQLAERYGLCRESSLSPPGSARESIHCKPAANVATAQCPERLSEGACFALQQLADIANRELPNTKRQIFLMVRCRRCLQHSRGGAKKDYLLRLPEQRWTWLQGVQTRCKHASLGKTLRIIIDFYMPLCEGDGDFEAHIFSRPNKLCTASSDGELVNSDTSSEGDTTVGSSRSPASSEGPSEGSCECPRRSSDEDLSAASPSRFGT